MVSRRERSGPSGSSGPARRGGGGLHGVRLMPSTSACKVSVWATSGPGGFT